MKFTLNPAFSQASGAMDEMMFRTIRGKVVAFRKPNMGDVVYSEKQIANRNRFKQAAAYGRAVMADNDVRPLYEAIAKEKDMPIFAVMIADFFNAPDIHNVDLSAYNGEAGNVINILASDDFRVENVHVSITSDQGNVLESGNAVETSAGSGRWIYTATTSVESDVNVQVVATDRPGSTTVKNVSKTF